MINISRTHHLTNFCRSIIVLITHYALLMLEPPTLFLLIPLTHLKLDWINFGTVKILEHSCREPKVVVKCCVRNFSNF